MEFGVVPGWRIDVQLAGWLPFSQILFMTNVNKPPFQMQIKVSCEFGRSLARTSEPSQNCRPFSDKT
jgi:hypothetical protein